MQSEKQESLSNLSDGVSLGLTLVFSVNRTVQIWSRVLGSTGTWFYGWMIFVGLAIQAWYYQVNLESQQAADLVSWEAMAWLSVMWYSIHGVVRSIQMARGVRFHSYDPGVGILHRLMSGWSPSAIALTSDLAIAVSFSCGLWLLACPILSGWYAGMLLWLVIGHSWQVARDARRRQIWHDAQVEADHWSQQIGS